MPRLDHTTRKSIEDRMALRERIRASIPKYHNHHCGYCKWASNGLTPEDAIEATRVHRQEQHASDHAEMEANRISNTDLQASFHDHDCIVGKCNCRCGCQDGDFCTVALGPLCSSCTVREGREDEEHGEVEQGVAPVGA